MLVVCRKNEQEEKVEFVEQCEDFMKDAVLLKSILMRLDAKEVKSETKRLIDETVVEIDGLVSDVSKALSEMP